METWVDIIGKVGFPIAACLAIAAVAWYLIKTAKEESRKREAELQEEIKQSRKDNKEIQQSFSKSIASFEESLKNFSNTLIKIDTQLDGVNHRIDRLSDKVDKIEIDVITHSKQYDADKHN